MTLRIDTHVRIAFLSTIGWLSIFVSLVEAQVPAATSKPTTSAASSTPDARRSALDLEDGDDDDVSPQQPGIPITLDFSLPDEKMPPLRGHNRQFTLREGLGARDLAHATSENKVVFYVDPVPVPLPNPSPKPGLPNTIWDIKGHDDPDATSVEVTFLLRLYSPLMTESARAWLRTHHLANSFNKKKPRCPFRKFCSRFGDS